MKDEVALLATVTLAGVLLQGDLCAKGFPRVAAAHLWPSRVRARLPSPGKLQRVLSAVPRHTLGRRHLLPRRRRSPVRTVLPVRAPPLFPGIRALGAAQADTPLRERARTLAAGGDGCTGLASPLPPRHATDRALQMAPGVPADGLRRRPSESAGTGDLRTKRWGARLRIPVFN
ncbi:leukotriene C4 synthase isoform X1 [Mus pahari]|uniref:leukotriene C4 synthase isoform X1 n=1 Tax=Mus pahari TaxID=10093 RepID=UPI000A30EBA2|nr:leukotriene C4 synthase isoform X1 [Mus pahari]